MAANLIFRSSVWSKNLVFGALTIDNSIAATLSAGSSLAGVLSTAIQFNAGLSVQSAVIADLLAFGGWHVTATSDSALVADLFTEITFTSSLISTTEAHAALRTRILLLAAAQSSSAFSAALSTVVRLGATAHSTSQGAGALDTKITLRSVMRAEWEFRSKLFMPSEAVKARAFALEKTPQHFVLDKGATSLVVRPSRVVS